MRQQQATTSGGFREFGVICTAAEADTEPLSATQATEPTRRCGGKHHGSFFGYIGYKVLERTVSTRQSWASSENLF
jgi:hypothetical protein